jgi:alpha-tubulin suppressor-like RCC1 family protein
MRDMSTGVYLWAKMPRLGSKSGNLKLNLEMPKGIPKRVEAFDSLDVKKIRIGLRHSAVIAGNGDLYTFGNGNWGVLGHGNESNINFTTPKLVETLKKAGVKVKDVALGEYHTVVLGEDGSVWTWGYGGKKGFFNWMYS